VRIVDDATPGAAAAGADGAAGGRHHRRDGSPQGEGDKPASAAPTTTASPAPK
jgi:hypothetical protein